MRFQDSLLKWRIKTKQAPRAIFLDDFEYMHSRYIDELNYPNDVPSVCVAGDFLAALDLRFVYQAVVHGASYSESRARSLFKRTLMFRPDFCSVVVIPKHRGQTDGLWFGLYTKEKGVICE